MDRLHQELSILDKGGDAYTVSILLPGDPFFACGVEVFDHGPEHITIGRQIDGHTFREVVNLRNVASVRVILL